MTSRIAMSILSLPLLVATTCGIDAWLAMHSMDIWDFSHGWLDTICRLLVAFLLIGLCRLLWSNLAYRRLFAAIYLIAGLFLSFARFLFASQLVFAPIPSSVASIISNGSVSQFAFAFIAAIGAAAFFGPLTSTNATVA